MSLSRRNQSVILAVLAVVLVAVIYWNRTRVPEMGGDSASSAALKPLNIENPSLHVDRLEKIRKLEYTGTHRNIFSASLPPPPPSETAGQPAGGGPGVPAPPPPLDVPVTFYGTVTDNQTGKQRAFFTNGDDVYIVSEGETLLNRFRLDHIGNNTVDVEELSSGRHATLTMEQPQASPQS